MTKKEKKIVKKWTGQATKTQNAGALKKLYQNWALKFKHQKGVCGQG